MTKRLFLLLIGLSLSILSVFFTATSVQAACEYPAFCDASPGTCSSTCNGGRACLIGNTVCVAPSTSNCTCDSNLSSCSNPGFGCDPDEYGNNQGFCTCQYVHSCGCTNTDIGGCCAAGGGCGWTNWSECSASCGGGTQTRTNTCNGSVQVQSCNTEECCGWTDWGACSAACGGGTQSRTNECTAEVESVSCNTQSCGVTWGSWSSCSVSCGGGTQSRTNSNGQSESRSCNDFPCSCTWGDWSACSAACGGGTQGRSDNCGNSESRSCNTQSCSCTVDQWSTCSAVCGIGTRSRYNSCSPGGIESETCNSCSQSCACPVACGQASSCGTCGDADYGQPGAITLTPSSGTVQVPADREIDLSWTAASKAENYDVQVYPTGTTAGQECTAPNTFCDTALTGTAFSFTAPEGVANYSWRVRANNTTCNAVSFVTATSSDDYLTGEGAAYDMTADKAVDNDDSTAWNAGTAAPQWIELDLQTLRDVTGIDIETNHFPAGDAVYEIYAGSTTDPTTLVHTVDQNIDPGDILNITFAATATDVRYIRIVVTESSSLPGFTELTPRYSDGDGSWTNGTFTLAGEISGNFYLDETQSATLNLATGLCELGGALTGQNPGAGAQMIASWQGSGSTSSNVSGTSYTIDDVHNYNNVSVTLNPGAGWRCSCPLGCTYSGQDVPSSDIHFFLSSARSPWWQTSNGLVYSGSTTGNALTSFIPDECTGSCLPYFSAQDANNASGSSGIVITAGGDIDAAADEAAQYSKLREDTDQAHVIGSAYDGPRENYQYFYNLYSMGVSPADDFTGTKPLSAPTNNRAYYAGGDVTISTPWNVEVGESLVIFVDGNLNVNAEIDVADGAFVAFIVSGTITFDNEIGNVPGDPTPNIEGVFIADRIVVEGGRSGGDFQFIGEGTFVGWTSVTLDREFADPDTNDSYPSEVFRFRPDFVVNVPDRMTRPIYTWQETN